MAKSKLSEYKNDYYYFTGKLSEINRQIAFAGIALIWIFKNGENSNLKIENENITFSILVKKTDLCNDTTYNAIANPYLNAEYIIPNRQTQIELEFKGQIFKDKIILDTENTSISLPNNQMILIELSM